MLIVALMALAASPSPTPAPGVAFFREVDPSESRCTLELSRQYRYTCPGRRPLSGAVRQEGLIRLVGVADEVLREQTAAARAAAQARLADPRVLIQMPEPLELSPELRVAGAEGRIYLVPPMEFVVFCAALGSPPRGAPGSTPITRRGHWFVLEGAAPAWLPTPLACPPELTNVHLSVDGVVYWIGQTEAAARTAIPAGYRLLTSEEGWTLRANSPSAQPYLIKVTVSKGRVTRVGLSWPAGSNLSMEAYTALLTKAFSLGESCRLSGASNREGVLFRKMEISCGARRLTSTLGDWPMGRTADITLE